MNIEDHDVDQHFDQIPRVSAAVDIGVLYMLVHNVTFAPIA